jgi:nitrate reductase beta subunit
MFGMPRIDVYVSVFQFNIEQLRTALEEKWDNIPQATINSLINSKRRPRAA